MGALLYKIVVYTSVNEGNSFFYETIKKKLLFGLMTRRLRQDKAKNRQPPLDSGGRVMQEFFYSFPRFFFA
jgi:hypothetical protein